MSIWMTLMYVILYFVVAVITSFIGIFLEDICDDAGVIIMSVCCSTCLFIILGLTGVI